MIPTTRVGHAVQVHSTADGLHRHRGIVARNETLASITAGAPPLVFRHESATDEWLDADTSAKFADTVRPRMSIAPSAVLTRRQMDLACQSRRAFSRGIAEPPESLQERAWPYGPPVRPQIWTRRSGSLKEVGAAARSPQGEQRGRRADPHRERGDGEQKNPSRPLQRSGRIPKIGYKARHITPTDCRRLTVSEPN